MRGRRLKKLKSVDEIPEQMTEQEAAEFYGSHDLTEVWDKLESLEEQIAISAGLKKSIEGHHD
ncbi:MAG: hypothetical protein DDT25_01103 [Chloroflexi bacterium]|nr:hypothetical protein [Chloroflexota bacterium]